MKVGIVGLGEMGAAMASHLLDEGVELVVWNRTPSACAPFERRGATRVDDPAELFDGSVAVLSMLSHDDAEGAVFDDALLARVEGLHIQSSTVSARFCRTSAERHSAAGVAFVAAPVLGRSTLAAAGTLNVVAAGASDALDRARPVLELIGKRTWELGDDPVRAALVKIAVNYNLLQAWQTMGESVALVERGGVDPSTFVEVLTDAAFTGGVHRGYGPMIAERRYSPPGFSVPLAFKDLGLAEEAARELDLPLTSAAPLRVAFESTLADPELAGLDGSAVAEIARAARDGDRAARED